MKFFFVLWILTVSEFLSGFSQDLNTPNLSSNSSVSTSFRVCNKTTEERQFFSDKPIKEKFKSLAFYRHNNCTEILQMTQFPSKVILSKNGFINTVMDAYNGHHNLVIRPDDVWAAIMTQFSFYVNHHAEDFRGKFVDFDGKKELSVTVGGSLRNAPYGTLVKLMSQEIHKNLKDPLVKDWILPNFSTTTDNDLVTVGVVFMATLKKYFDYEFVLACGIPEITLACTVKDWQNIHQRLEQLKEYKLEKWYAMLEPVLQQFVNAKKGNVDLEFWRKIAHHADEGSGSTYISGWITVFSVFDKDGNWQETNLNRPSLPSWLKQREFTPVETTWLRLDTSDISPGVVEVDVKINDNGKRYNSVMFAGHVGTQVKADNLTVKPVLGWAIALKPE